MRVFGKRRKIANLLVLFTGIFLTSCFKDYFELDKVKEYQWEPSLSVPLINSTFDFEDFVNESSGDSLFTSDQDDVITFIYEDKIASKKGSDLFPLSDQSFSNNEIIPFLLTGQILAFDSIVYHKKLEFDYSTSAGQLLDSILIKEGMLDIDLDWNFNEAGKLDIVFSSIIMPTDTLRMLYEFPTNSGVTFSSSADLANAKIDLTQGGTTSNKFVVDVTWTIYSDGNPMPNPSFFGANIALTNPQFKGIFGYLGNQSFQTNPKTKELISFGNLSSGTFILDDPKIRLTMNNSFGVSAAVDLDKISIDHNEGTSQIEGQIAMAPVTLPGVAITEIGSIETLLVEINKDNSNIVDLISKVPKELTMSFAGSLSDISNYNFALDTNFIDVTLSLELPLVGRISGLTTSEVYDFNGSDIDDIDNLLFQLQSTNEFPFDALIQVYFQDDSGDVLDSLLTDDTQVISASFNSVDGTVLFPGEKTIVAEFDETRIASIRNSTAIRIKAILSTYGDGTVTSSILNTHTIRFNLGIQTKFSLD